MAEQTNAPSRIPRASRLPVPSGPRPSPSRESLRASSIVVPRLRNIPSRDQLSSIHDKHPSTGTGAYSSPRNQNGPSTGNNTISNNPISSPISTHHHPVRKVSAQPSNSSLGDAYTSTEATHRVQHEDTSKKVAALAFGADHGDSRTNTTIAFTSQATIKHFQQ